MIRGVGNNTVRFGVLRAVLRRYNGWLFILENTHNGNQIFYQLVKL